MGELLKVNVIDDVMTYFEAKEDLILFFDKIGLSKKDAEYEFINLDNKYGKEVQIVIREALKQYIMA